MLALRAIHEVVVSAMMRCRINMRDKYTGTFGASARTTYTSLALTDPDLAAPLHLRPRQ
jgi:hypothetical protein